jgi:hypothetical protein
MSLDDLEDHIHALHQRRRLQDQLDALEADAALDGLVAPAPERPSSGSLPKLRKGARKKAPASVVSEASDHDRSVDEAGEPGSAEEQAAAQLEASARRTVAVWAGHPKVTSLVERLRPDFRVLLDKLAIDPADRLPAAARILGMWPTSPDGTELPNFFVAWPPEKLAAASLIASQVRSGMAEAVTRLRSEGVGRLPPIDYVSPDDDTPDGLEFGFQHVALLLMLWLDIPLKGHSGVEIAADLPMLGTVGWERHRSVLLVANASQPDVLAGDALRRAFVRRSEREAAPELTDDASATYRFADPEVQARLQVEFEPPADPIERHKLPGWGHLQEFLYLAEHPQPRSPRHRGRPAGPSFIQTRDEIEKAYGELWTRQGRRPFWSQVATALGVDERTLRRVRRSLSIDSRDFRRPPE